MFKKVLATLAIGCIIGVGSLQAADFWTKNNQGFFYTKSGKYYVFNKKDFFKDDFDLVETYKNVEKSTCSDKGMADLVKNNNGVVLIYIMKDGVVSLKLECD